MELSEKYPRRWLGSKFFLSSYIIMAIISLVVGSFLLAYYIECEEIRKNIDFEHPVMAKITKASMVAVDASTNYYVYYLYYEYVSLQNVYYTGLWREYNSLTEAESHLGEEITIYLDSNGGSTPWLSDKNQKIWALILSVILLTAGVAIIAILIVPHRWKPPKPPKQKKLPFIGVGPI